MAGATLTPEDAYRVARGEVVESQAGGPMKLVRPLDFIVVADHAENLGITDFINRSDPVLLASPTGKRWHDLSKSGEGYTAFIEWVAGNGRGEDQVKAPEMMRTVWDKVVENAEKNYVPGAFTTFIAFEWTSGPNGNNLHRNVIFRDGAARTKQVLPYSLYDSEDPEDLWAYMAAYESKTGGKAFAIPHNGNLSNGVMFQLETLDGKAFDTDYAKRRQRGNRWSRSPSPRVPARRIRCCHPTMPSRTSRCWTRATCRAPKPRRRRCSRPSTPARPSRTV